MSLPRPDAVPSPSLPSLPDPVQLPNSETLSRETLEELPFLVRTVRQADLAILADVLASSFHSQEGWMRWLYPVLKAGIYEDLRNRLHTRGAHYACLVAVKPTLQGQANPELVGRANPAALNLLAGRTDLIVGTVEISLKTPPLFQPWSTKYLYLSNLAVNVDYRRRGIAQQLLQRCERIALDWGFHDLYLHVLENNHQARRLYRKSGYRLQRIEVNPLTLLLGQPRQLFLHKRLD